MPTNSSFHSREILLCTLNSTYQHCSFGLRYLFANLAELQPKTEILEFTIKQTPRNIVEILLAKTPKIVGFGVYIWNTTETEAVISILKKVAPEVVIVLGGPEVSHETESQTIVAWADYVIKGEADFAFRDFCRGYLAGQPPEKKIISAALPEIQQIQMPYSLYSQEDIQNRVIYVEASRGCPYRCEYCLSSLDKSVRSFDLDLFLSELQKLIDRGARTFKFVDRTFNLSISSSNRILGFFLERIDKGLFLHFEMVPDRLPPELKEMILKFPPGSLQFEVGIQTWNPEVAKNVSRRNDFTKVRENFKFLKEAKVHTHADLIVGLPGETFESFAIGFNELASLEPDEIQVGILKRLKGTPIIRHDSQFKMTYQNHPPFQILANKDMDYMTLQKMNRFAKYWDLYANSGQFSNFVAHLKETTDGSFFHRFFAFSEFLSERFAESFGISLLNLTEAAYIYLTEIEKQPIAEAQTLLLQDYCFGSKRRDIPSFLRNDNLTEKFDTKESRASATNTTSLFKRQERHQFNN